MIKEKVLELLSGNDDFISGQALAQLIGVSRNSIWKAVKALLEEGYEIESRTNLGYRLDKATEQINKQELGRLGGFEADLIQVFSEIPSTNTYLKEHQENLPHHSVILSGCQTAGRGRQGRSFHSPASEGLYFSILYKDPIPDPRFVTLSAGLAVAEVLEGLGLSPAIKWVNDIYLGGRKVCGILTEGELELETGQMKYLVLGIGLNINNQTFPEDLSGIATSLSLEAGRRFNLNELAASLLQAVDERMNRLMAKDAGTQANSVAELIEALNDRLYLKGCDVTLSGGNQTVIHGELLAVDENGHLVLRTADGTHSFHYGEYRLDAISVR